MKDHVKVIGILWVVFGAFCLCLAFFALLFFFGVAQIPQRRGGQPGHPASHRHHRKLVHGAHRAATDHRRPGPHPA